MAGQFHAPSHPGVLKNVNMNGNILQIFYSQEFPGVPKLWPTSIGEKQLFHHEIFSPLSIVLLQ